MAFKERLMFQDENGDTDWVNVVVAVRLTAG